MCGWVVEHDLCWHTLEDLDGIAVAAANIGALPQGVHRVAVVRATVFDDRYRGLPPIDRHAPLVATMDSVSYTECMDQDQTSRILQICRCCFSDGVPRRSLLVALIVGTILNLINQGDSFFGGSRINWAKIVLTFVVPYCVATYGAVSYRLTLCGERDDAVAFAAKSEKSTNLSKR